MKTVLNVYEIREGVFALGRKGKRAKSVCTFNKRKNAYVGIRGVKPLIADEHKRASVSKAAREKLAELAA